MAPVGHHFSPYETWMQSCGLSLKHVARVESEFTAQAYIATDLDANQITAFRPGAMNHSHANRVPTDGSIQRGVISQDGREGMLQHAERFAAAGILFLSIQARRCRCLAGRNWSQARWVAVNAYEGELLSERRGSQQMRSPGALRL